MSFASKAKDLLGIAKPGGIDDLFLRALKTALGVILVSPFIIALPTGALDYDAAKAAVTAGVAAGGTVVLNAVLLAVAKFVDS